MRWRAAGLGVALAVLAGAANAADGVPRINRTQSIYLQYCGGCHGISGASFKGVPDLLDQVGYFLCGGKEGREYLGRLPNVAFSMIPDQTLADVMNFMIFDLGRKSTPAGTRPYTAAEMAGLRKRPLAPPSLLDIRDSLVTAAIESCGAPEKLRDFSKLMRGPRYRVQAATD